MSVSSPTIGAFPYIHEVYLAALKKSRHSSSRENQPGSSEVLNFQRLCYYLCRKINVLVLGRLIIWLCGLLLFAAFGTFNNPAQAAATNCSANGTYGYNIAITDPLSDVQISGGTSAGGINCSGTTPFSALVCAYFKSSNNNQNSPDKDMFYATKSNDTSADYSRVAYKLYDNNYRAVVNDNSSLTETARYYGTRLLSLSSREALPLTLIIQSRPWQDRLRATDITVSGDYYNAQATIILRVKINPRAEDCYEALTQPTYTFQVSLSPQMQVFNKCAMENLQDVDFGTQGGLTGTATRASETRAFGNVGIRCTYKTPYSIALGDGMNFSNGFRRMKSGANYIAYQLFQPGCNITWSGTSRFAGIGNSVNAINNHQVCGQLTTPLTQAPPPGTYSDTVVVTATF